MNFLQPRIKMALGTACFIAYHGSPDKPVPTSAITAHYNMKPRALEQIIQKLSRKGILQATRGKNGGYFIATPTNITLANIAQTIIENDDNAANKTSQKGFHDISPHLIPNLKEAQTAWLNSLSQISLAEIVRNMTSDTLQDFDFCI